MLLRHKEPIQGVANYEELPVFASTAGIRITEVRLDAKDFDQLAKARPEQLAAWADDIASRFSTR